VRYFVESGVPADRFRAIGLAETRPVEDNVTAAGRAANRRVEFLFVNPPATRPARSFLPAAGLPGAAANADGETPRQQTPSPDTEAKIEPSSQLEVEPQPTVETR
jgi:hypothetical protein